jgi:hypothetical protein
MAAQRPGNARTDSGAPPRNALDGWREHGGTGLAGVLMIIAGILGVLQGVAGIAKDTVYATTLHYVYSFNITAWGWINLVLGVVLCLVGIGILSMQAWAQWAGILIAAVSLALQFMFLPYYPIWALIAIAMDVFVIWALLMSNTHTEI